MDDVVVGLLLVYRTPVTVYDSDPSYDLGVQFESARSPKDNLLHLSSN